MTFNRPLIIRFECHRILFGLFDFGFVMILFTINPNIKTCNFNCIFIAYYHDGSSCLDKKIDPQNIVVDEV